ncbi:DUF2635 domain-containing protein [Janthinobacterium sp. BJB1]|nr:DUF2635 domain-containing protein [Janthinobacterium sp. BJB1]
MFVKPAPGLRIPDPDLHDFLPEQGREVPDAPYWQRRIHDQDVVIAVAEKSAMADAATSKNRSKE